MDYSEYGGSVLLGLDGTVVKAHGSSNAKDFIQRLDKLKIAGEEKYSTNNEGNGRWKK